MSVIKSATRSSVFRRDIGHQRAVLPSLISYRTIVAAASSKNRPPVFSTATVVERVRRQFVELGDPRRAAGEKAYLKSALRFHGVTVPQVRRAAVGLVREHPHLTPAQLRTLCDQLFATDFHDLRSLAIGLLEKKVALLQARDLPWLVEVVRLTANWAHVDWLATKVVGPLVAALPAARRARQLGSWARDGHLWVRRTALLAQLDELRAGGGDFALFAALAGPMLEEKEFFIRKAIGWVLREVSHRRPALTFAFLQQHRPHLSGLTFREGSRRLPPAMQKALAVAAQPGRVRALRERAAVSGTGSRPARRRAGPAPRPAAARAGRSR
jgi:3-methyladenine DNA glycosylase AlkD